jgi:hypothetical protein
MSSYWRGIGFGKLSGSIRLNKFGLIIPMRGIPVGGSETKYCKDIKDEVEVEETCVKCSKYRAWDGTFLQCRYEYEREKELEEIESGETNSEPEDSEYNPEEVRWPKGWPGKEAKKDMEDFDKEWKEFQEERANYFWNRGDEEEEDKDEKEDEEEDE